MTDLINIKKIKELLKNDNITGYEIWKKTSLSQSLISELRRKKRDLYNLSIKTAIKLQDFINEKENENEKK